MINKGRTGTATDPGLGDPRGPILHKPPCGRHINYVCFPPTQFLVKPRSSGLTRSFPLPKRHADMKYNQTTWSKRWTSAQQQDTAIFKNAPPSMLEQVPFPTAHLQPIRGMSSKYQRPRLGKPCSLLPCSIWTVPGSGMGEVRFYSPRERPDTNL